MLCCSNSCEKKSECNLYYINNFGIIDQIEDFANCGSGSISSEGIKEDYWCGKLGNYKMFRSIQITEEEFKILHCSVCGCSCDGPYTKSFECCRFKSHLKYVDNFRG